MDSTQIALARLLSQHLAASRLSTPRQVISSMAAVQAQDFPMARWALGLRVPGSIDQDIEAAINRGDILRTHLLRPTWHFVASEDIVWLIDLTAPHTKAAQRARDRQLELTEEVYTRSNQVIERALSQGRHLVRDDLVFALKQAGIATDQNRASHLFMRAELDKLICSGASRRGKPTYALLAERVPQPGRLNREEALAELARRYFTSRCPASLQDFSWWSGLRAGDAGHALDLVKSHFTPQTVNERTYWLPDGFSFSASIRKSALLLPPYDEFILSYADRSASFSASLEKHMKAISDRGVFRPIIVIDGRVVGIWKRSLDNQAVRIQIQPLPQLETSEMDMITQAATSFACFIVKSLDLGYIS